MLPGIVAAGKALPGDVQAAAKEEWADAMAAATAAAEHARRAQEASDAAERFARGGQRVAPPGADGASEAPAPTPAPAAAPASAPDDLDVEVIPPILEVLAAHRLRRGVVLLNI